MPLFRKKERKKPEPKKRRRRTFAIKKDTLKLILEVSKETYPKEFAAQMIAKKGIIQEINLLPGTLSGDRSATLHMHMAPPDITLSVVGIVHSHPSYNFRPSGADLFFFQKYGHTHIIVGRPYDMKSWAAYDSFGEVVRLEIVD
jgi:proteasome lid subunit RPN8/RPN11